MGFETSAPDQRNQAVPAWPSKRGRPRFLRAFALITAMTALLVGAFGVAPAMAATATLTVPSFVNCQDSTGRIYDYGWTIQGLTNVYPNGFRLEIRLWGDDSFSDDLLQGPFQIQRFGPDAGGYFLQFCINRSTLDEDIGTDEIYAGVRVFDRITNVQKEVVESNRVEGNF